MKANDALVELLARIGAAHDGAVFVATTELSDWPKGAVAALKEAGLLAPAAPAGSVECDGCEQRCFMPVEIAAAPGRASRAFIACDKRDDIARVDVPLARLERWQASGEAVAALLAARLNANRATSIRTHSRQWAVGIVRGQKKTAPVMLSAVNSLMLELAGHSVSLEEILSLTRQGLVVRRAQIERYIDNPKPGGRRAETPLQRRQRLRAAIETEKAKGTQNPVAIVAVSEGISRQMLHRLVREPKKLTT